MKNKLYVILKKSLTDSYWRVIGNSKSITMAKIKIYDPIAKYETGDIVTIIDVDNIHEIEEKHIGLWVKAERKYISSAPKVPYPFDHYDWLQFWDGNYSDGANMLFVAEDLIDKSKVVIAACKCAREVIRYIPRNDRRPIMAIEAAERWAADPSRKNAESLLHFFEFIEEANQGLSYGHSTSSNAVINAMSSAANALLAATEKAKYAKGLASTAAARVYDPKLTANIVREFITVNDIILSLC